MKRRKRGAALLLLVCLLFGPLALASDSGTLDNPAGDYMAMKKLFNDAMAELKPDLSDPAKLRSTLTKAHGIAASLGEDGFQDSGIWAAYIQGLIQMVDKEYAKASETLKDVAGQPGFEAADQFIAYAQAMVLMDQQDMIGAAIKFGEAGELLDAQFLYEQMTDPKTINDALQTMFEGKQYEEVLGLIDEMERQHIGFEKSHEFADYARGLLLMDMLNLDEALSLLSPLSDIGFMDTLALCEYIRGWQYQDKGELELAIGCYLRAQAAAQEDAATRTDEVLDLRRRLIECQRKLYASAEALYDAEDYLAAKEIFEALGDYLDSAQRAEKCQKEYDAVPTHVLSDLTCKATGTSSIWLEWRDTRMGSYEITYAPVGVKQVFQTAASTQTYMELTGLFPGTEYRVTIKASGERGNEVTQTVATLEAKPFDQYGLELLNPLQVYRYDVADAARVGMEAIIMDNLFVLTDGTLVMPEGSLTGSAFSFVLTGDFYCDQTEKDKEIELLTVLRAPELGVFGHVGTSIKVSGDRFYVPFYVRLEAVLDKLYADLGDWPGLSAQLEIYFDGALLDTLPVALKKQ